MSTRGRNCSGKQDLGEQHRRKYADIIAASGDLANILQMMKVEFVMKAGVLYKHDGAAIEHVAQAAMPAAAQGEELEGY